MLETLETVPLYSVAGELIGFFAESELRPLISDGSATVIRDRKKRTRRVQFRAGRVSQEHLAAIRMPVAQCNHTVLKVYPDHKERNGLWWWEHRQEAELAAVLKEELAEVLA